MGSSLVQEVADNLSFPRFPPKTQSSHVNSILILKGEVCFKGAKTGSCSVNLRSFSSINRYIYMFSSRRMCHETRACERGSKVKNACDLTMIEVSL